MKKKVMDKKVFISGSRSQEEIPQEVQKSLEKIKEKELEILIGDSEKGVDNQIINYLRKPLYKNLTIFKIKQKSRINVESDWNQEFVDVNSTSSSQKTQTPQEQQMEKDRAMANQADFGLAIFKPITKNRFSAIQVSSGTLRNTIQMLIKNKPVKFFYVFEGKMYAKNLKTINDLKEIIELYKDEKLSEIEIKEIRSSKGFEVNNKESEVKYKKINEKFKQLYEKEKKQEKKQEEIVFFPSTEAR